MSKKIRKTLNVSLQSKKYSEPINRILNEWEEEGANTSAEVCEIILLFDKYDKSITLSNIKNVFELIQKMVGMYIDLNSPDSNKIVEEVLSEVISIDNGKLSSALAGLNEKLSTNINRTVTREDLTETSVDINNVEQSSSINQERGINDGFIPPTNNLASNTGIPQRRSIQQEYNKNGMENIPQRRSIQQEYNKNGMENIPQRRSVQQEYNKDEMENIPQRRSVQQEYSEDEMENIPQRRSIQQGYSEDGMENIPQRRSIQRGYNEDEIKDAQLMNRVNTQQNYIQPRYEEEIDNENMIPMDFLSNS